jgi:predicted Zn finger-like uncharacterized protein
MLVRCPHCRAQLKVRDDLIGKTARCPKCSEELRIGPEAARADPLSVDFGGPSQAGAPKQPDRSKPESPRASEDEYGSIEAPRLLAASRTVKKKRPDEESEVSADAGPSDDQPKRRKVSRRSTLGMLASLIDGAFWESALRRSAYLTGALVIVGGLVGFLTGLIRSAIVAGMVLEIIGIPTAFLVFFLMCYPTACFWKVVIGSAEGGRNIAEWPEGGNVGEWMFEMLFVGYMVAISLFVCGGIAKLGELVIPHDMPTGEYWRLVGTEEELDPVSIPGKLLAKVAKAGKDVEMEVTSPQRVLRVGPAWVTMFFAFAVIFPFVVASCLESSTPIYVPWSTLVWRSLIKNLPAWLAATVLSCAILSVAVAILVLGATYAPFLTFTLCSPLAVFGLLLYGRLLGRLSWLIART